MKTLNDTPEESARSAVSLESTGHERLARPTTETREIALSWGGILLYWALFLVIISTFPWFTGEPHWERIVWIPFIDVLHSFRRLVDAFANLVLYLPLGFAYVQLRPSTKARAIMEACLLTLLLAGSCEFYQVFSPVRYPTMTDIVTNTLGALIGAALGTRLQGKRLRLVFDRE